VEAIETYEHQGVTVEIHYDEYGGDFCNPRTSHDGNLSTMVCWHPDYVLGDYQITNEDGRGAIGGRYGGRYEPGKDSRYHRDDFSSMRALARYIGIMEQGICILPLYLYDHSDISISAGSVNPFDNPTVRRDEFGQGMGWDTSMVGFVYTTADRIRDCYGFDNDDELPERTLEAARESVLAEVSEYDSFLRGEVYGFIVDNDGPDEDACWGFVGDIEYCKEAANESAECAAQARAERQRKRGRGLHRAGFVTAGGTA